MSQCVTTAQLHDASMPMAADPYLLLTLISVWTEMEKAGSCHNYNIRNLYNPLNIEFCVVFTKHVFVTNIKRALCPHCDTFAQVRLAVKLLLNNWKVDDTRQGWIFEVNLNTVLTYYMYVDLSVVVITPSHKVIVPYVN